MLWTIPTTGAPAPSSPALTAGLSLGSGAADGTAPGSTAGTTSSTADPAAAGSTDSTEWEPPVYSVSAVVEGLVMRIGAQQQMGREEAVGALFQLLSGADMARALLAAHGGLAAARSARHRLQRLAPLRALAALMGWRVAEPATARWVRLFSGCFLSLWGDFSQPLSALWYRRMV